MYSHGRKVAAVAARVAFCALACLALIACSSSTTNNTPQDAGADSVDANVDVNADSSADTSADTGSADGIVDVNVDAGCPDCTQLRPHIKTFGYTYGFPQTAENLEFVASHLDIVVGIGDFQTKRVSVHQYDTMKAVNPNIIIIPYTVIQAYTFDEMRSFFSDWISDNGGEEEELYLHYYNDNIVKMRVKEAKTSGTGTPTDRICDKAGTLLPDGTKGGYYVSLGFGGGTATSLSEARVFQFWNSGWKPRINHLSTKVQGAYKDYIVSVLTVDAKQNKYVDGVYLDTYAGVVDVDGYLPNMHQLVEVRDKGFTSDDTAARSFYSQQVADLLEATRVYAISGTGKSKLYFVENGGTLGYVHDKYAFAHDAFISTVTDAMSAAEYLTSPSTEEWMVEQFFKPHYDEYDKVIWLDQCDTSWLNFGETTPSLANKQFMLGSIYLFMHKDAYFGIHYGTPAKYGPGVHPNISEAKGGKFSDSHWEPMMDYDVGHPVVREGQDLWGKSNTDRMYVVEHVPSPGYPIPGRYVIARDFSKAKILVRFERSDDNPPYEKYGRSGEQPQVYDLGGSFRRLQEDGSLGPVATSVTLGLSEGAIMIKVSN